MTEAAHVQPRHPVLELLARYRAIFAAVWAARHELAGPKRLADEAAFLPAALSLQETPAHPAPRRVALVVCTLFIIALIWSIVGEIDIVAVAPGRIVVSERTKTLQPLEASVVKRVLVKDGDQVQAGQVLVELDATNAVADGASVQEQLSMAISEERRTTALISALQTHRVPSLAKDKGASARDGTQLQAEWSLPQRVVARGPARISPNQRNRGRAQEQQAARCLQCEERGDGAQQLADSIGERQPRPRRRGRRVVLRISCRARHPVALASLCFKAQPCGALNSNTWRVHASCSSGSCVT